MHLYFEKVSFSGVVFLVKSYTGIKTKSSDHHLQEEVSNRITETSIRSLMLVARLNSEMPELS